jgi:4-hydroxy-3-polyprenylbenzoate decarboxylase
MALPDLQSFIRTLEAHGEVHRVPFEVDPVLEVTEVATRALIEDKPALLFESVRGSPFPLAINLFATPRRIELALGRHPGEIGEEVVSFLEEANPPRIGHLWRRRKTLRRLLNARPRHVRTAASQEVVETRPDLTRMPVLQCWPEDGGRFLTLPLVHSKDPETHVSNLGIYRMQVFSPAETGMHMQLQKGGGFHYWKAEKAGKALEMAVTLGGDPALILAAVMALPEGIDEIAFSGIVRGRRTPMRRCRTVGLSAPASAEFVLEGVVEPGARRLEGPFGDHFGHYSSAAQFPIFSVRTITRKRKPVYPATVVGRPPQEDRAMGDATQHILKPFIRLLRKEVRDIWAYYESGFHNLLVVSVETRYEREPLKTALGILGEGQLSLTKCLVLVGPETDPSDFSQVLVAIREEFDPEEDFHLIARTPLDTLDFTGDSMHHGSKMVIDATPTRPRHAPYLADAQPAPAAAAAGGGRVPAADGPAAEPRDISPHISAWRTLGGGAMLVAQVRGTGNGRSAVQALVARPDITRARIAAVVSEDVSLDDTTGIIWGIFTRFDPARDIQFTRSEWKGVAPVHRGVLGIDATWKAGYQKPLVMDPAVVQKVDSRWESYWR